jgi:hypothetical protein
MFDEPTTPKKCHYLVFAFLDFDNVSGFLLALIKGNYHENSLTMHSQNFHHRVIGISASSSKFHHGFDFVHGVLGLQLRVRLIEGFLSGSTPVWGLLGQVLVLGVIDRG